MEYVQFVGSGNSGLPDYYKERLLDLVNIPINEKTCADFIRLNIDTPICQIEFSTRKTKARWGSAVWDTMKVILYRWCVGVFLHELAHIKTRMEYGDTVKSHGNEFWENLAWMVDEWDTTPFNGSNSGDKRGRKTSKTGSQR